MAINTKLHLLVDKFSGQVLSDATVIAPELEGANLYDIGGDLEALIEYAEEAGVELYAPGDPAGDLEDVSTLEGFSAYDTENGGAYDVAGLRLVPADLNLADEEDADVIRAAADAGEIPLVSSAVHDLKPLPETDA